jgi:hypothetical protein
MDDDANHGSLAAGTKAVLEALTLALLERGVLSGEDLREALEAARGSVEDGSIENRDVICRMIDELVMQTYAVTPRRN